MASPRFQPDKILEAFTRRRVRFVVIGGLAALAHGSPYPTGDVDITPDPEADNLQRVSEALSDLDAKVWFSDDDEPVPFSHDATSLASSAVWKLVSTFGRIDLSLVPTGTQGYRDLVRESTDAEIVGVVVPVASLADVIRSKQAANRPKDQRVLPVLREILAERHRSD